MPPTIYPPGNAQPDGSLAELFIESTDGDAILNQGGYTFDMSALYNGQKGLQNLMDVPDITMWGDDTPMTVTDEGRRIAPSLADFSSDRPFHLDELAGEWFAEAVLAENATGTRADPVIVRDGDRGRLIPCCQTPNLRNPAGDVAAEIVAWLMGISGVGETAFRRGDANGDGALHVADAIYILNYLFLGGPAPPASGPGVCGPDPSTSVHLGCARYTKC